MVSRLELKASRSVILGDGIMLLFIYTAMNYLPYWSPDLHCKRNPPKHEWAGDVRATCWAVQPVSPGHDVHKINVIDFAPLLPVHLLRNTKQRLLCCFQPCSNAAWLLSILIPAHLKKLISFEFTEQKGCRAVRYLLEIKRLGAHIIIDFTNCWSILCVS